MKEPIKSDRHICNEKNKDNGQEKSTEIPDQQVRSNNIRLFWYYFNSVLLPIIFLSGIGVYMSIKGITIQEAEGFPTIVVVGIYSVLLYLNFTLVRKFTYKWVHFAFGVLVPIGTLLILGFLLR